MFLDQCFNLPNSIDMPWVELSEEIHIMEAHVDAIELGEDLARETALEMLAMGDEDEVLGAAYALASVTLEAPHQQALIDAFTQADDELLGSYVTAFRNGLRTDVVNHLIPLLKHDRSQVRVAVAQVLGYRRVGDAKQLWPLLHDDDMEVRNVALVALARLGDSSALPAMEQAALEGPEPAGEAAILALLRLGSERARDLVRLACLNPATATPNLLLFLAMAGGREDFKTLQGAVAFPGFAPAALQALGLFGEPGAIPELLEALQSQDEPTQLAAATALDRITGAGLREAVLVPEEEPEEIDVEDIIGTDEAEGAEADAGQEVEATAKPDAAEGTENDTESPRMLEVVRVSTNLEAWSEWLQANAERFSPGTRYRFGQPFTFGHCIDEIAAPNSVYDDRQRAYLELVIRSGEHIAFEPDWFVGRQVDAIKQWQAWWDVARDQFVSGRWLFKGEQ